MKNTVLLIAMVVALTLNLFGCGGSSGDTAKMEEMDNKNGPTLKKLKNEAKRLEFPGHSG